MSDTKKNLLNENTIRRFMKLAEIDTLSDGFVNALSEMYGVPVEEEKEVEEGMGDGPYARDDDDPGGPLDLPAGEPEAEPELEEPEDLELDMEPEEADPSARLADAVEQFMAVVSELTGLDIDVDSGEEAEEAELPADEPAPDDLDMAAAGEEEFDQETIVNEITRRVTARLQQENHKDAVADQLSERILQRIKVQSKK